jgi:hypothetical protein
MNEIILFGRALKAVSPTNEINNEIIITAAQKGYAIHPDCNVYRVKEYLDTLPNNYNTTFYKSFDVVRNSTRIELLIDQLMHYASTYGTDYQSEPYIPNIDPDLVNFTDCKVISPISQDEICEKINDSFKSGIALATDTIKMMLDLIDNVLGDMYEFDCSKWKNKEAIVLYKIRKEWSPDNNEEFIRMMVYICTNDTLIIKNNEVINTIKQNVVLDPDCIINMTKLFENYDMEFLSQDFNRYKELFLALRKRMYFKKIINKLSKLSKKHHKPMNMPIGNVFLTKEWLNDTTKTEKGIHWLTNKLSDTSIFQKERWLQAIRKRLHNGASYTCYNIRNGKSYFTINNNDFSNQEEILNTYKNLIYISMINQIKEKVKGKNVIIPHGIEFVVPTSGKNFINHIPLNSYMNIHNQENAVIGITWKGKDGADDLDLAYLNIDGDKIGWNGSFADDKGMVFSGDMTSADPEASEMFYCPNGIKDGVFSVNNYSGNPKSDYHFFIAKDHTDHKNKCIDPNNILFQTKFVTGSNGEEQSLGIFVNNTFYFTNRITGRGRVSTASNVSQMIIGNQEFASKFSTNLEGLLIDAGANTVFSSNSPSIDLTTNDKTVLIELLS